MPQRLTILGATGSVGRSTLDVVALHPGRFEVFALTANASVDAMAELVHEHRPRFAVLADEAAAERLLAAVGGSADTEVLGGAKALETVAAHADCDAVMAAIVGGAGLPPTLAAARSGKRVLLANKEALVMSGALFMQAVAESGAVLLPIDSEHNALYQAMEGLPASAPGASLRERGIRRLLLTASGGPFRTADPASLHDVTPAQAVAHPNWSMGRKISVDSATMMNKGLEIIEACWLFDARPADITVVVHPQSIIHSLVEYDDGSMLAQLGNPDMRTPIAHALGAPARIESGVAPLDLISAGRLDFEAPDLERFPCLRLGFEAARAGTVASAVLNAANEVAVQAFLDEQLRFTDIAVVVEESMGRCSASPPTTLGDVLALDAQAREVALAACAARAAVQ